MKTNALLLFVLAASLVACNEDSNLAKNASNELGLSVSISSKSSTRALKDVFANADKIGVFITGTDYTPKLAEYTFDGSAWSSPASVDSKIYLTEQAATVYGFYPSNAVPSTLSNNDANTITVAVSGTESSFAATSQIDYMYAVPTKTVSISSPATILAFKHALAKVSFVVNKTQSFISPGALTVVKLAKTSGFLTGASGALKLKDGSIAGLTSADDITFTGTATANAYNATPSTTKTAYGLVAPIAATSGIALSMTIDGHVYSATLPATGDAASLVAGKEYVYTINMKGSDMTITSVSVTDWTSVDAGSVDMNYAN